VRLNEDAGQYEYLGDGFQRGHITRSGFFMQDNWRIKNNLTINAGLRYELQTPFVRAQQQLLDGDARGSVRRVGPRRQRRVQPVSPAR
jgi:outer membrane receptor protein involved in Fe transport